MIMFFDGQQLLKIATAFYGMSLVLTFFSKGRQGVFLLFLVPALLANTVAVGLRFWTAWPMLPMYAGPLALPLFMAGVVAFNRPLSPTQTLACRGVLSLTFIIALAGVLFPKDYYIPFIKSQTVWSHLFFWLGVAGRVCFFVAAAWAMAGLFARNGAPEQRSKGKSEMGRWGDGENRRNGEIDYSPTPRHPLSPSPHHRISPASRSMLWTVWGFAFWTLSMFTGELWSYLGWGTPVVWDDPAITTTMATWFFYICLLHLHLTGSWTARSRGGYTAAGALVVLVLNCVPELGPFRWPI